MTDYRSREAVLRWAEEGRIPPTGLRRALAIAGALPEAADWRLFLDRLLLWLGAGCLAAGVVFFFAYNWDALGRFGKFALVQLPILACLALIWRRGLDDLAGQAAVLTAALFVGALFALIGQTYQTGADTYELFTAWALAILPWALLARLAALWVIWLALVNLAIALYLERFGLWDMLGGSPWQIWPHVALNLVALTVWEFAALRMTWLRARWAPRLVATAAGVGITSLMVMAVADGDDSLALLAWPVWLAVTLAVYVRARRDLYIVAGALLSGIVVATTLLGRLVLEGSNDNFIVGFLFIGIAVIGLTAAAAAWLRRLSAEVTP